MATRLVPIDLEMRGAFGCRGPRDAFGFATAEGSGLFLGERGGRRGCMSEGYFLVGRQWNARCRAARRVARDRDSVRRWWRQRKRPRRQLAMPSMTRQAGGPTHVAAATGPVIAYALAARAISPRAEQAATGGPTARRARSSTERAPAEEETSALRRQRHPPAKRAARNRPSEARRPQARDRARNEATSRRKTSEAKHGRGEHPEPPSRRRLPQSGDVEERRRPPPPPRERRRPRAIDSAGLGDRTAWGRRARDATSGKGNEVSSPATRRRLSPRYEEMVPRPQAQGPTRGLRGAGNWRAQTLGKRHRGRCATCHPPSVSQHRDQRG